MPPRRGRDRREEAARQENQEHAPKDARPGIEGTRAGSGAEDQHRRRDREERPRFRVQLEERVHPVVDEHPLREEHEEERGGEEPEGQTILRLLCEPVGRQEKQENACDAEGLRRERSEPQEKRRHQENEPARRFAPAVPGQASRRGDRPKDQAKKEEEPEVRQDVHAAGAPLRVPAEAGSAASPHPQGADAHERRPGGRREGGAGTQEGEETGPRVAERGQEEEKDKQSGQEGDVPRVGQDLRRRGETQYQRAEDSPLRAGGRVRVRPDELEHASRDEEEQGDGQHVRMEIREEEAPERVLVDRVGHDARRSPEVVPVEVPRPAPMRLVDQPLPEPREVPEDQREPDSGEAGAQSLSPVPREAEGALRDRSAEEPEREVEREARGERGQEREEGHHLLAEDVVAQRRSREPGIRGRK